MKIAVTGGTGFIGYYILQQLLEEGHQLSCWFRDENRIDESLKQIANCQWIPGELGDVASTRSLLADCQAVVHCALWKPGGTFRGGEGDVVEFCRRNILGSLQLIEAARDAGAKRFVYISTCAVHEKILDDRMLDEAHPLWPLSDYGAHKAAVEKFVHSYGFGKGFPICALRPTGVYGLDRPLRNSKWFELVQQIVKHEPVTASGGGKEVHAGDVAKAVSVLLNADDIAGEAYNCYDRYISRYEVANIAKRLSNSQSEISGEKKTPKHQVQTGKIEKLGLEFGGERLLQQTIQELVAAIQ